MDYHLKEALSKKSSGSVVLFFKLYRDGTATITKLEGDEVFFCTKHPCRSISTFGIFNNHRNS